MLGMTKNKRKSLFVIPNAVRNLVLSTKYKGEIHMTYAEYKNEMLEAATEDRVRADLLDRHIRITNCEYKTLGIKTPFVKKLAKSVPMDARAEIVEACIADAAVDPIYETVLFASFVAARKGDYAFTLDSIKRLVPLFGSWAHVDCTVPCLKWASADRLMDDIAYMYESDWVYEKRFYIICLMCFCLTEARTDFALDRLQSVVFGEYYVDMAVAWALSEAAVKFYGKTVELLRARRLPKFVQNKAIQKARESFRLTAEQKAELSELKIA